ncbi:hypothetical protein [Sediminibacillus terrae]|nr:hypothetical protein [Sediminibacillus terrae]
MKRRTEEENVFHGSGEDEMEQRKTGNEWSTQSAFVFIPCG